ncbi:DinB family protein [Fodinibius sediminis]|uniref:DinB superfamily protein n=1 Tax=Fodinibius sediminis TaxID=1214077 RepID=A0A521DGR1_9BACT|nr:DinB family protein [Fodinibius sediminis]SMO70954.1 DinB superfamily protein [Fodinibius sediminis]
MILRYSYDWFIQQFEQAGETAETFLLSVDEAHFLQSPSAQQWSIAECYHHLIKFGNIYHRNLDRRLSGNPATTNDIDQDFPPRWFWKKVADFFEPPYTFKMKTVSPMRPDAVSRYNRLELLDEFINLQERFVSQLRYARKESVSLRGTKVPHPLLSLLRLTFSEYYLLTLAHQRRHQWQAEQTLSALEESYDKSANT